MGDSVQRLRDDFEAQFEISTDRRILYRRSQKGEPIPVSADERQRFVDEYLRRIRFILFGMMGMLLLFSGAVIAWSVVQNADLPQAIMYVGISAIAAIAISMMYWVRGAPARALQGCSSVGRERSKEEMRAIVFEKISYGQLAMAAAIGVFLILSRAANEDITSGWHRVWLVLGVGLVLAAGIQAIRKWRVESADR